MAKSRRTFTPEFKAQAVKLVTDQGKSLAEVARDLDLGEGMLGAWKQALAKGGDHAFPGKGNPPALEEELRRLRAENKRPTMEPLWLTFDGQQVASTILKATRRDRPGQPPSPESGAAMSRPRP